MIDDALKIVDESCQCGPAQVHCEMPSANAVPALVDLSKNADLVVVAAMEPARCGAVIWVR